MLEAIFKNFESVFQRQAEHAYFSPGRINLIGEHTDYNGGHVFPAAITIGTYGLAAKREDGIFRFYSENFSEKGIIEVPLSDLTYRKEHHWTNYAKGMIIELQKRGILIDKGLDIYVKGTIPNGAGLSSSASLELLIGIILEDYFASTPIERLELVYAGKAVENHYIGVNSGIMDQFAIGMGQSEHAMLLDTNTMVNHYVPAQFGEYVIVIMNTNKRRELADSKYNERRSECEEALRRLQSVLNVSALGQLNSQLLKENEEIIADAILYKRAKHAVTENERTLKAQEKLQEKDLVAFGQLLNQSHMSLRDDYEVTGMELDTLVESAWEQEGVLGARMTGAGFGGCAIALVHKDRVTSFISTVGQLYIDKVGYAADFYEAHIDNGARKLK